MSSVIEITRPLSADLEPLPSLCSTKEEGSGSKLLDLLPAAIYVCDAQGRIQRFNRRAAELWGREPLLGDLTERFCGSHRMFRLDGGPLPHDQCPMADVLRTGTPVHDQEVVIEREDGARSVALVNIEPLKDAAGNVVGAVNCFHDITERKRVEQEHMSARNAVEALTSKLAQERDHSRALMDALPAAVYTTDAAGQITYYNEAAVALWGCRPELGSALFCGSWKLYWPDGKPMAHDECPMATALKERRPIRGEQAIAERPDGTRIPFIPYPTPRFDEAGNLVGAVNMLVDISEQQQLETIRQRLAAIVESSEDAIVSKDLNGIITSWNAGAERIFGYTAEEVIGKPVILLIPAERLDEEAKILTQLRRGQRVKHYETVRRHKDGSSVDVSLTVSPVYDAQGRIIGASKIARDITERKRALARQELLSHELQHRTRNIFAVVQSVVARSFEGKRNLQQAKEAVLSRLLSLAHTHSILVCNEWRGASLAEVVCAETRPYAERVMVHGPSVELNARAAQNFALALHELATNAAKHGALSNDGGHVVVCWSLSQLNGESRFNFRWEEHGGPPVARPRKKGFGSAVLIKAMTEHVDAPPEIVFAREGLRYELSCPLHRIKMVDTIGQVRVEQAVAPNA